MSKYNPGVKFACTFCGRLFQPSKDQQRRGKGFCSRSCRMGWQHATGKVNYERENQKWTSVDETLLIKEYVHLGSDILELRNKFTRRAINKKARKLGLKVDRSWLLDEKQAREYYDEYKKSGLNINQFGRLVGIKGSYEKLRQSFLYHFPDEYADYAEKHQASPYQRGRAFEYRVREYYKHLGYWVLRSPQSRGPADLICLKKGEVLLVQCKLDGRNHFSRDDEKQLVELAESVGGRAFLVTKILKHKLQIEELHMAG